MSADNIKVAIRVRPLIARELRGSGVSQWKIQEKTSIFQIDESGQAVSEIFAFDRIFEPDESNEFIYKTLVESFIESTLNGVNSTVFAYGQTSSGKTYTMLGDENNPGIMTLAVQDIFNAIEASSDRKYLIRVAYLEIYNEKVIDLLGNPSDKVHVREVGGSVNLINLTEEIVSTPEQVLELLRVGTANRQFGETNLNERSSRSHTIFKILLESTDVQDPDSPIQQSTINLVDLAGSERASQTKATGVRLFEGGHINKSLSTLSLVIRQITEGREFVNFRDCKLTQILRNSLGGNAKTLIIANVTIASVENTLSTLLFAQTAKTIKCKPQINEVLSDAALSKRYALLSDNYKRQLEDQLKTNQDLKLDKETKTKTIDHLRKVIQNLEYFANHSYDRSDSGAVPKRRHTICFLGPNRNNKQSLLPIREGVTIENFELTNFESTTSTDPGDRNEPITEREHVSEEAAASSSVDSSPDSTPKGVLRKRLQILQEEHLELVRFTRDEKDVRNEEKKTIEELENRLNVLQRKFEDETKLMEAKIATLNDQLSIRSSENELVVAQLKTKFKKREEELVAEIDRLKVVEDSKVFQSTPSTVLDDLMDLQNILMHATDEASIDERVLRVYQRVLEENTEQIAMLSFVVENLKLLCETQSVTGITSGDFYKMHFLLDVDEDKTDAFNVVHHLCLQFIKLFDTIKYQSDSGCEKLNYAQAELQDVLFILRNERELPLDALLPVLTRCCSGALENYVKVNDVREKIDCLSTILESFRHQNATEYPNDLKQLSKKLTGEIRGFDEQQILTFLNKYAALCSGLKRFDECSACAIKQNDKLTSDFEERKNVITDLTAELANLNTELMKEKSKKCENCETFESHIKTLTNDLQQEKQEILLPNLVKIAEAVHELGRKNDYQNQTLKAYNFVIGCQGCENSDLQIAVTDLEQKNQALHLCNENLKREIEKLQSDIDSLNDELNLNTKFDCDMIEDHSNIVEDLKSQIQVLEQKMSEGNIVHEKDTEAFKLEIDDLNRKLCSSKELENCLAVEHSTVVEDLKSQIEALKQKLCECDIVHEKDVEAFKLRIDDLNRELCSSKELENRLVVEHSTVVQDLKSQIEVLKQKLYESDIVHEKDVEAFKLKIDDLNRELCSSKELDNHLAVEHSTVVEDLKSQIEVLKQKLCECDIVHEKDVEAFKLRIDDLNRELCSHKEHDNRLVVEHSTVVEDLKSQIEVLKRKLCECDIVHKTDVEAFKLLIDDLNKKLRSSKEFESRLVVEHSTVVEDLKSQIEVLKQKLCECDIVHEKDKEVLKSRIDDLISEVRSHEKAKNRMSFEHNQSVFAFESKIEQLMRKLAERDRDLQLQTEAINEKHEKIVNDLKSQVATLQIQIDKINSGREALINDYQQELQRLKRYIEEQASERRNDQVKFKINRNMVLEHKNTIKNLKGQIVDLEGALQSSNDVKNKMIFDHKNAMEELESQVQVLEKDLNSSATLKSQIENLMAKLKVMGLEYKKMVETYEARLSKSQSELDKQLMIKQDNDRRMAQTSSRCQELELELTKVRQSLDVANLRNAELNKQLQVLEGQRIENDKLRVLVKELQCNIDFYHKEQLECKEREKNRRTDDREFCLKEEKLNNGNSEISLSRRANEVNLKNAGIIVGQGKENSEMNCKDCSRYRDHLKEQTKVNGYLKENFRKEKFRSDSRAILIEEHTQTIDTLKRSVEQLNAKNLALTVKIQELESANVECVSCAKLRDEAKACQKEMASLTRKLVDIQAEYYSLKKANTKQDKSEFIQLLEDRNDLLQNRTEKLTKELKEMKARCQSLSQKMEANGKGVEMATKELQCNILDEEDEAKYKTLFEKYKLTKQVAIMRKEQIDELKKKLGQ